MKEGYLTTAQFALAVSLSEAAIRKWDSSGFLKPVYVTEHGRRFYTQEQVDYVNNNLIKIGRAAELIGVSQKTLRDWDRKGKIKPNVVSEGNNTRYYSMEQIKELKKLIKDKDKDKEQGNTKLNYGTIAYIRVDNDGFAKSNVEARRQRQKIKEYAKDNGESISEFVTDLVPLAEYADKGFEQVLEGIISSRIEKIIIYDIATFGHTAYVVLKRLCETRGVELEVVNTGDTHEDRREEYRLLIDPPKPKKRR